MKGLTLKKGDECFNGAIEPGTTGITITFIDGFYRLEFSSLDSTGMISYKWLDCYLNIGDIVEVTYNDVTNLSKPKIHDYNSLDNDKLDMEHYLRLKKELGK